MSRFSPYPSASPIINAFGKRIRIELHEGQHHEVEEEENKIFEAISARTPRAKRSLQHVSTKKSKKLVLEWMVKDASVKGEKHVVSRAVAHFPEHFRGSPNANLTKASRWCKAREQFFREILENSSLSITRCQKGTRRRVFLKASSGRGRKREPWVNCLHEKLLEEFTRLRKQD